MQIHAYLSFNGNCREAMRFYHACLGGKLQFQTVSDTLKEANVPPFMKNCIVHARLTNGNMILMGSDLVCDEALSKGNNVMLTLQCETAAALYHAYSLLADGGMAKHPISVTAWGSLFGTLIDKYSIYWMLNHSPQNNTTNHEKSKHL